MFDSVIFYEWMVPFMLCNFIYFNQINIQLFPYQLKNIYFFILLFYDFLKIINVAIE